MPREGAVGGSGLFEEHSELSGEIIGWRGRFVCLLDERNVYGRLEADV